MIAKMLLFIIMNSEHLGRKLARLSPLRRIMQDHFLRKSEIAVVNILSP